MVKEGVAFLAFAGPALAAVIARGGEFDYLKPAGEPKVGILVGTDYPVATGTASPPPPITFPTGEPKPTGTAPRPKPNPTGMVVPVKLSTSHGTTPIKPTTSHGTAPAKPTTSHGTAPVRPTTSFGTAPIMVLGMDRPGAECNLADPCGSKW
ncbi:hypothetical protein AnigIFM59636_011984 [Aspergillus niger]|nr:hypothetical protein AnigIFM59636_011984 [Aspergillus niger]